MGQPPETREFTIDIVLSIVTGRMLVEDFSEIHEAIEWIAGEPIWTHQLPRVCKEAEKSILAWYPQLADIVAESKAADFDTPVDGRPAWHNWLGKWYARIGKAKLVIHRLDEAQHERIEPLSELVDMAHPKNIIAI